MDNRETMASYDTNTLTISSMNVAQHDILRLTAPDNTSSSAAAASLDRNLASMDAFDHDLGFEGDLLDPTIPFTPSYELSDAFSATFEDPFSYTTEPFSHLHPSDPTTSTSQPTNPTDAPSLDNKLLGFSTPLLHSTLLTSSSTQTWPSMTAELYGMFFVAEDVFGSSPTTNRPMELTCYRRNLFQISGNITLSRDITHVINEAGQSVPVYELLASISAVESIEGKNTEIISVPWKTSTMSGGIGNSEEKSGALPPKWPLDLSLNPELDPSCVSLPLAWKRLQFKHATANNGRRKGLQQHYVIQINLLAMTGAGEVKVAEMRSGAIIVRGRSPRNFDGRRDVPLSEKREPKGRTSSDAAPPPVKVDPAVTSSSYRFYALNQLQQPLDLPDWSSQPPLPSPTTDSPHRPFKKPLQSLPSHYPTQSQTTPQRPPIPKTKWSSTPSLSSSSSTSQKIASAPIDLSLADEEYRGLGTGRGSPEVERQKRGGSGGGGGGGGMGGKAGVSGGGLGSPVENLELLYEYFPLSLDDWMPPVDAIYRPHVVHHTWPPDFKAQQVTNKTKRYFSADD